MNTKWKIIKTGIKQHLAFKKFLRLNDEKKNNSPLPEQFVADMLELGPVFIKVGQILSTRPDIMPVQYITALEKLQENVPPFDFKEAKKIIEEELSQPVQKVFQSVEEKPIASASLSQVHFAVLKSGEKVALKVQRPDVKAIILNDLKRLEDLIVLFKFFFSKERKTSKPFKWVQGI